MMLLTSLFRRASQVLAFISCAAVASAQVYTAGMSDAVTAQVLAAGTNQAEIAQALADTAPAHRDGLAFLLVNMPDSDLKTLPASLLLTNLDLAYTAWEQAPWRGSISEDMFLNNILPYASLSEPREEWRANMRAVCLPMIAGATKPGEAAQLLNQKIFPHFKVKYDTTRLRPDQSPSESLASGKATCTGLTILLVDACRSVGIPARIAGTAMWANMRGNHTWVEIWDGDWHFLGAAEPDQAGLDHAWFVGDAAKATKNSEHAIWATSFARTTNTFPMVWLPGDTSVPAVDVTDRYAAKTPPEAGATNVANLAVQVLNDGGTRTVADVTVVDAADATKIYTGKSHGPSADINDLVTFKLLMGGHYHVTAQLEGRQESSEIAMSSPEQLMTLVLPEKPAVAAGSCPIVTEDSKPLPAKKAARLKKALGKYFAAPAARQAKWKFSAPLEALLATNEPAVRQIAWEAFRDAPIHADLKTNFDKDVVTFEKYLSPYTVKTVGTRPAKGWALFIAMHGGGGAPQELNDSQWKIMQRYYKNHPEAGGYLYLALRAPNNTWNGFYDDYVYPLIDNLILQFRLFGDIDPDKVFIMGYSHGGYGAYAIGPKMPDRFAAIHASAGAATEGESVAETLRTTPFTAMVGELDTAYDRRDRNERFAAEIEKLRGGRTDIYPVTVTVIKGNGHTGLPDRDLIKDMYPAVRNPVPHEISWLMTDAVVKDFFWLHDPAPAKKAEILASFQDNRFVVTANQHVATVTVYMDGRMVDFSKPVNIELNGSTTTRTFAPSLKTLAETMAHRGDPEYAFTASFTVTKGTNGQMTVQ